MNLQNNKQLSNFNITQTPLHKSLHSNVQFLHEPVYSVIGLRDEVVILLNVGRFKIKVICHKMFVNKMLSFVHFINGVPVFIGAARLLR